MERLNIAEWLDEKARKEHICPVCQQKCSDDSQRNIYLSRLEDNRKKKKQMEEIPAAFESKFIICGESQHIGLSCRIAKEKPEAELINRI